MLINLNLWVMKCKKEKEKSSAKQLRKNFLALCASCSADLLTSHLALIMDYFSIYPPTICLEMQLSHLDD